MSARHKPSRRKASATSRLRRFWILFAFVLALGGAGAYFAATWPALDPHQIDVAGNRVVSSEQIVAAAAIDRDKNLWLQSSHAIAARIERIPLVDRAWIHRRLLADVTIVVTERIPFAAVPSDGGMLTIDDQLRVLSVGDASPALPRIDVRLSNIPGPGQYLRSGPVRALSQDLQVLEAAGVVVRAVGFDRYGGLIATRRDGLQILLGDDDDLPRKLALLGPIERQTTGGRPIKAIDLRAPATPVIVYRS